MQTITVKGEDNLIKAAQLEKELKSLNSELDEIKNTKSELEGLD